MTVFGCHIEPTDPWVQHMWLGHPGKNGHTPHCNIFNATEYHCILWADRNKRVCCDGRCHQMCMKELHDG